MKSTQRLDYNRLSDALVERGLVGRDIINHILHQCQTTGSLLSDLLVGEDIVSDWELSRVACELYHIPFVTVDICPPADDAMEGLDPDYLRQYALVPLERFGKLLTVAMPGLVPTDVLEGISVEEGGRVLPLVGTVKTNRRWLLEHLPPPVMPSVLASDGEAVTLGSDESWTNIFDAGDEAVQLELNGLLDEGAAELGSTDG